MWNMTESTTTRLDPVDLQRRLSELTQRLGIAQDCL